MSLQLNKVDDEYYLIVNHPALYRRARELKFRNAALLKGELNIEDIEAMQASGKNFAMVFYNVEGDSEAQSLSEKLHHEYGLKCMAWNLPSDWDVIGDQEMHDLNDTIRFFPNRTYIEMAMVSRGFIHDTDYTGRCGNCASVMEVNDKYCRCCGTPRGEGEFLPFDNNLYGLYGPPIKRKYKCNECGRIWISGSQGFDYVKFCPQCGNGSVIKQQDEPRDWFDAYIGIYEPYDHEKRPVLLSEKNVEYLLKDKKRPYGTIFEAELVKIMKKANIPVPDTQADAFTRKMKEIDGERMTLTLKVLKTRGAKREGFFSQRCPYCKSHLIAGIEYELKNDRYQTIAEHVHAPTESKEPLLIKGEYPLRFDDEMSKDQSAYYCMQCGEQFGSLFNAN